MRARISHYVQWYELDSTFDIDLDTILDREDTTARVCFNILPSKEFYKTLIQKLKKSFLDEITFEHNDTTLIMHNVWVDIKTPRGMIEFVSLEFESIIEDVEEIKNDIELQKVI